MTHRKRTDPSLPEHSGWFQDLMRPEEQNKPPSVETRTKPSLAHQSRNVLQLAIIALLLTLIVMERKDYLRNLIPWPVQAGESQVNSNLKVPNDFVKQQYQSLSQTLVARKQMIKHAKQVLEMSNRDIERFTFDMSVAEMALNKIKSEYDVTGLDE